MMTRGDRLNAVLRARVGNATTKAVLFVLDNYAGNTERCWPSIGTVAEDANCSEDSVRRALAELRRLGVVRSMQRWGSDGNQRSNVQIIDHERLLALCPPRPQRATPPPAGSEGGGSQDAPPPPRTMPPRSAHTSAQEEKEEEQAIVETTTPCGVDNGVSTPEAPQARQRRPKGPMPPIPPELDSDAFRAAWNDWLAFRRESKYGPMTPTGAKSTLTKLVKMGQRRATEAVILSTSNEWRGVWEDRNTPKDRQPAGAKQGAWET